jgi:37-kD nucleoid-associated bacterial protein
MRYPGEIVVKNLILHVTDPHNNNVFLSERELLLGGVSDLPDYFIQHIYNSLRDPMAKAARFSEKSDGSVFSLCKDILEGTLGLVVGSQKIARSLVHAIERSKRISSGILAVFLYTDDSRPDVEAYLGLLKLDLADVYRHKMLIDPVTNEKYIELSVESNVLPSKREKLQKCAFIQPIDPEHSYDMLLLDRQSRQIEEQPVAKYFLEGFLSAALAFGERERTESFYKGTIAYFNELINNKLLPGEEIDAFRQSINHALNQPLIDTEAWIGTLNLSEEYKSALRQKLLEVDLVDGEFEVDHKYVDSKGLTKKRIFQGDEGLRLELPADEDIFNQLVVDTKPDQENPSYNLITLRTEKWSEIVR